MRNSKRILILASLLVATSAFAMRPEKDTLINMSWQQKLTRDMMTSGTQQVNESDLEHITISDIRRRLRGLFLSAQVLENCGGLNQSGVMTSPFFNSDQLSAQSRCFWNVACIIDDVPVPMNQYLLDPNQIESITMITDIADKAAYGPVAAEGAFYIRTKKGGYDTPLRMTFDFESGIEMPGIWPEYCNGEQYAILNNIAREQSGYNALYSAEDIKGFANGSPNDIKYPNVDYRDLFFNDYKPVSRFGFNATAGSKNIKFNTSVNGLYGDDLVKIGPSTYFSKLNLSTSVTAKIGQWVEANATFNGLLTFTQDGNGGSFGEANFTSPIAFPLTLDIDPESEYYDDEAMGSKQTIYGVSKVEPGNPYAAQIEGGYQRCKRRSGMFSSTINFDMSWLLPGLKSKTFVNIATFFSATMGKNEDYLAFNWDREKIIDGRSVDHVGTKVADESVLANSTFQTINAFERLSYNWGKNGHKVNANLTGWITDAASSGKKTPTKLLSGIATVKYSYNDRYVLDLVSNNSGTTQFKGSKRWGWFPAVGAAWNLHNEGFMKNVSWIDYLKIRGQYGKIGDMDIYGKEDNLWEASYHAKTEAEEAASGYHFGPNEGTCWFGTLTDPLSSSGINRFGNEALTWPVITEFDAGFDATLFNQLDVKFNWYKDIQSGVIMNVSEEISNTLGQTWGAGPTKGVTGQYGNHDQYTYKGWELGLGWHKDWKDFGYNIGVEGRHWDKINDIITNNFYRYDYQDGRGRHASEWRGYIYDGILTEEDIASGYPTLGSGAKAGDLKYKDVNEDGKIDSNDKMYIASGNAKLRFSVNLELRYKKFDFYMVGTGQAGYKAYLSGTYFMGGYSVNNYSKFIWDQLTATGTPSAYGEEFPRLCYIMNNNNFECSEYWLRDGSWFKIQSVELGYTTDLKRIKWIKGMRLSLRGTNLCTFTKVPYIDPEATVAGIQAAPLYKAFTFGAKFNF